jgi:hypothetical protein
MGGVEITAAPAGATSAATGNQRADRETAGLGHVATASFLASRAAPSIGFWVALAGGVALARAGERRGLRLGYGASVAAMLQTVAIIGPSRFAVPLTQALSAPLLGVMEARRRPAWAQVLACSAIRLVHNAVTLAFAIVVLTGGLGVYTDTYDSLVSRLNSLAGPAGVLPEGATAALIATAISLVAWTAFASIVQVLVYRRGLSRWPAGDTVPATAGGADPVEAFDGRFDPRAVALAAAIAFVLLLSGTSWLLLGSVAAWLVLAWLAARGDNSVIPAGAFFAAALGGGVLVFTLIGGLGLDHALRRGLRAALLVMVATWLRSAAGSAGLREVSQRVLGRLKRIPSATEAAAVMDSLGSGRQLGRAGREAIDALRGVRLRPVPVADAAIGWVVAESRRFHPAPAMAPPLLRARPADAMLVALALCPLAALL